MRSDVTKVGRERAPHRALLKATGLCDEEIRRPFIGVVNSCNDFIPGHIHLDRLGEAVKAGIRSAGGVPFEFQTIGVCDGIAMGHKGMRYSLPSRELIEDTIEIMAESHQLDGLVMIPTCDKIVPGHIMAAGRLDLPTIVGGPLAWRRYAPAFAPATKDLGPLIGNDVFSRVAKQRKGGGKTPGCLRIGPLPPVQAPVLAYLPPIPWPASLRPWASPCPGAPPHMQWMRERFAWPSSPG